MKKKIKHFKDDLFEISPPPKRNPQPGPSSSRKIGIAQKAILITSSPYKSELEQTEKKKLKKVKPINFEISKKVLKNKDEDFTWFCILCEENTEENMIQCMKCHSWVHTLCAGVNRNKKKYYCTNC